MSYSFSENEELSILRETIRKFSKHEILPVARELDKKEQFDPRLLSMMGDLGLCGMTVSPDYGGYGFDCLSYIIAVEELARFDSSQSAVIAAHNSLGVEPLFNYGTEEQKKKYIPSLCDGSGLWAFGLTEASAGSDAQSTKTTAQYDESKHEWVINGSKLWITNSGCEQTKGITVQAITGKRPDGRNELSCFLVPTGTPGLTSVPVKDKLMWRAVSTGELFFDNVRVPEENMLGKRGQGFKIMMQTLDNGRLSIAAMGLGLAKGAYELALKYSKERETFGKPICKHQTIAFKLADMATKIEAAENMLYKACWTKDNNKDFANLAAMSKLYCSEVAEFCAREGQQIYGGYGLMKEYDIERHYRDATILRIGEGTSEILRLVISRYIGC